MHVASAIGFTTSSYPENLIWYYQNGMQLYL